MEILKLNELSKKQKTDAESLVKVCLEKDKLERSLYLDKDMNFDEDLDSFYLLYVGEVLQSILTIFAPLETEAEISAYTLPEAREKGYFNALLDIALDELADYEIERVLFVVEPDSNSGLKTMEAIGAELVKSEYLLTKNLVESSFVQPEGKVGSSEEDERGTNITIHIQKLQKEKRTEANVLGKRIFTEDYTDTSDFPEDNTWDCFGAYLENKLIGVCNVTYSFNYASIFGFGVEREYRGKGYGRKFLQEIMALLKDKGVTILNLAVSSDNKTAYSLYKRMGFMIQTQYDYYEYLIEWE